MPKDIDGRNRKTVAKWLKEMLPKKCMNCGSTEGLTYHHVVPVSCGGNDVPSNIMVLCSSCHDKVHYGKVLKLNHGEMVKAGIARAKERGVKMGRKPCDHEAIMKTIVAHSTIYLDLPDGIDDMMTETELREKVGLKLTQYCKVKKELKAAIEQAEWPYSWPKPTVVRNVPLYDHIVKRIRATRRI